MDTWDILEQADEDPENASAILDVYANGSYDKQGGGGGGYNREHAWPKSYGFPNDGSDNYPYSDMHHLFLADENYNSSRSNKIYGSCNAGCIERPTSFTGGTGGGEGLYPGYSNWTEPGIWETWIGRRGDVARALFYLDVRYAGGEHGVTGASEPDLILTDDVTQVQVTGSNATVGYMGRLSTLLTWHDEDPVDDLERQRNDVIYAYQGNRNPFIDHPEWVPCLFGDECEGSPPVATVFSPWINEIHYDNVGGDLGEGFEIAGASGMNLLGWKVIHYNGADGGILETFELSGSLSEGDGELGFLFFPAAPLQNGSSDGLALVEPSGNVVEFLSWEGTVTASEGAAFGLISQDIGIAESGVTPMGNSLQRTGAGSEAADFSWVEALSSSGSLNSGQVWVVAVEVSGLTSFSAALIWALMGFSGVVSLRRSRPF